MSKKPLTKEEKLELIVSGEKFTIEWIPTWKDVDYFGKVFKFSFLGVLMKLDYDVWTISSSNLTVEDLIQAEIHKYEEVEEEWLDISDDERSSFEWLYSVASVKKSWIIEKAKEFGMEFKDER